MKNLICLLVLMSSSLIAVCQDKQAEAKVYYTSAEQKYTHAYENYNENTNLYYYLAIKDLNKAEKVLGNTNSKILYLKIKAMQKFSSVYYAYDLDSAFTIFFRITDANTYPSDKYAEMIIAKNNFKENIDKTEFINPRSPDFKESAEGYLIEGINFEGRTLDSVSADTCFYQAALKGNAEAPDRLYRMGLKNGCEKYYKYAKSEFLKAAEFGNVPAMKSLGVLYSYMNGLTHFQDCDKAEQWLKKAASLNNSEAMYRLGLLYSHVSWVCGDSYADKALIKLGAELKIYTEFEDDGTPKYMTDPNNLEPCYYFPDKPEYCECFKDNEEVGLDWFIKAVDSGDKKSYLKIAVLKQYALDINVRKRAKEAFEKFQAEKKFAY